jgi:hypothetical protein
MSRFGCPILESSIRLGSWADRSQVIKQTLAQHPSKDPVVDHAPPKKVPQSATKTEVKADKAGVPSALFCLFGVPCCSSCDGAGSWA